MNIYLLGQAKGQLALLFNTVSIEKKLLNKEFSTDETRKIELIKRIKKYAVDSLGYKESGSYESFFDNRKSGKLWVVTACSRDTFQAYQWVFPWLGAVDYKGYFNYFKALKEANLLFKKGYDVDVSEVGAWSTLGILNDPVFYSMLNKADYKLVNLIFHELFHSTRYLPGSTEENENLANFVAHHATLKFLQNQPDLLSEYLEYRSQDSVFTRFIEKSKQLLSKEYLLCKRFNNFELLKDSLWAKIILQGDLQFKNLKAWKIYREEMIETKNAFIMHYVRYDCQYDSLQTVLNQKFKGEIAAFIRDLKE